MIASWLCLLIFKAQDRNCMFYFAAPFVVISTVMNNGSCLVHQSRLFHNMPWSGFGRVLAMWVLGHRNSFMNKAEK